MIQGVQAVFLQNQSRKSPVGFVTALGERYMKHIWALLHQERKNGVVNVERMYIQDTLIVLAHFAMEAGSFRPVHITYIIIKNIFVKVPGSVWNFYSSLLHNSIYPKFF